MVVVVGWTLNVGQDVDVDVRVRLDRGWSKHFALLKFWRQPQPQAKSEPR